MEHTNRALVAVALFAVMPWLAGFAADADLLARALDALKQGDAAVAERDLRAYHQTHTNDPQVLLYLGWAALDQGALQRASDWLDAATRLAPTQAIYQLWVARTDGLMAKAAGIPGGVAKAIRLKAGLERALELDPKNTDARMDLIKFCLDAPAFVGGGHKLARKHAERLATHDRYLGLVALGRVAAAERHWDKAEQLHRQAIALATNRLEARYALGDCLEQRQQWSKAAEVYEELLALRTPWPGLYRLRAEDAWYHLGHVRWRSGEKLDRALAALEAYLKCHPDAFMPSHASTWVLIGKIHERHHAWDQAKTAFEAAVRLEPDLTAARQGLKRLKDKP